MAVSLDFSRLDTIHTNVTDTEPASQTDILKPSYNGKTDILSIHLMLLAFANENIMVSPWEAFVHALMINILAGTFLLSHQK